MSLSTARSAEPGKATLPLGALIAGSSKPSASSLSARSMSVALLLPAVGSMVPAGAAMVAVLARVPELAVTVPVTVIA